jgi:hypothetical protein
LARAQQQDKQDDALPNTIDFQYDGTADVPEKDMWEGESWETVGTFAKLLIPATILLALFVGGFAAKTYNEGAECVSHNLFALSCQRDDNGLWMTLPKLHHELTAPMLHAALTSWGPHQIGQLKS